jgi:hypothetical protein
MAVIAERRSLQDMNARYRAEGAGDDDRTSPEGGKREAPEDPRLRIVPGELA